MRDNNEAVGSTRAFFALEAASASDARCGIRFCDGGVGLMIEIKMEEDGGGWRR